MELRDAMLKRRSVRKFLPDQIPDDKIDILMEYAMSGPSAHNKRPWEFYIIKNQEVQEKLRTATKYTNMISPLDIVVVGNTNRVLPKEFSDFWIQDCSASIENILLGATDMGIGTCWCGLYPNMDGVKKVQEVLGLDESIIPLGLIHLGYPVEEPQPRTQYDKNNIHIVD